MQCLLKNRDQNLFNEHKDELTQISKNYNQYFTNYN